MPSWGPDLVNKLIFISNPIKKTIPGIPIDVAVNYADFAISI